MYGYIYETTNLINGKKYIGQHVHDGFDFSYKGSGRLLKKAFVKYGKENFECRLLVECNSKEELNEEEINQIMIHNADKDLSYYNLSSGGEHSIYGMRTMYNKDTDQVIVSNKENIEYYKSIGFILGMRPHSKESNSKLSNTRKNMVTMTDGTKTIVVNKDLFDYYSDLGFKKGRDSATRPNQKQENRKWVNNGEKSMMVKQEDLESYLSNGYSLGRLKFSHFNRVAPAWNKGIPATEESKRKNSLSHIGKVPWNKK